jgi:hypothetical protein
MPLRTTTTVALSLALSALGCAHNVAGNTDDTSAAGQLPRTRAPRPTVSAITAADLMTRLYIFADDSMEGRRAGSVGSARANAYIERELRRLGLQPAGENGGYYQDVPLVTRSYDATATLAVEGGPSLRYGSDFLPSIGRGTPRGLDGAQVVYGGAFGDDSSLSAEQVRGKLVLFTASPRMQGFQAFPRLTGGRWSEAAGVALVTLERASEQAQRALRAPSLAVNSGAAAPNTPVTLYVSRTAAEAMLGRALDGAVVGTVGRTVRGRVALVETPMPARNLVAIIPGSDPALRGQYVAIGAHNDHIGVAARAADHDSLRAFNRRAWELRGMVAGAPALTAEQRASITVNVDSLHQLRPARRDSINNGADDDGSGSMALLEIAEHLQSTSAKPRRSMLFVWHTGEELGLLGSQWFTDHPTVPRDSIVAQINIDMIGRGGAQDTRGGGPNYLGLVGSRRLSTQLGDLVEAVNRERSTPLVFDYSMDANGHPENIYCRSDHYMYARYGIPIVFFFTGLHEDYHQVTDEPQYIAYPHYASITQYVKDLAVRVSNLDQRPVVDHAVPAPGTPCRQ